MFPFFFLFLSSAPFFPISVFPQTVCVRGSQFFLKMRPPFVSLLASALFRWPCSISIHLSPRSVTAGVRPFPLAMYKLYSFVSQVCRCWCPPFSVGPCNIWWCPPFSWPCSTSIHLFPRSGTVAFYSFVSQVCWCPPFSLGHVAFLFMCLPGMSLLVSTPFRW